jgi:hypothetical protein
MLCIGLFGTCGGSSWRNAFMQKYQESGIEFYNPQVEDWKPELAEIEAEHLVNDEIILFPVTDETYGTGSLAETGYSIMQAINSNSNRSVVLMIHKDVKEELKIANPALAKESARSRALVRAHLSKIGRSNIYFVETLEEMLEVSLKLHQAHTILNSLKKK